MIVLTWFTKTLVIAMDIMNVPLMNDPTIEIELKIDKNGILILQYSTKREGERAGGAKPGLWHR